MDSTTRTSTMTTPTDRSIRIERVFDAPRELLWRALTEPDLVAMWWGRGNPLDVERLEVERGGHWRFVEHAPDGEATGFEGRFGEVSPPDRMVQTFEWDGAPASASLQSALLEDLGDARTKLVNDVLFFTTEERDQMMQYGMKEGMDQSYAALDNVLAAMA